MITVIESADPEDHSLKSKIQLKVKVKVRNGSVRPNPIRTVRMDLRPRTVFWSGSGWQKNHGLDHRELDQKSGSNRGSGPDHGSTSRQQKKGE